MNDNTLISKEIAQGFEAFPLSTLLAPTLKQLGFNTPTPIQSATIPLALSGRDLLASAETGSGKTLAYALPIVHYLLENKEGVALVIAPTRELAEQVMTVFFSLISTHRHIHTALLIGGTPIWKQIQRLDRGARLIVGTPGRINDHIERGKLRLEKTRMLVIDEADRMLDMGFGIQLDAILDHLPKERQTLMFSATYPKNIQALSKRFLDNPERITIGTKNTTSVNLTSEVIYVKEDAKFTKLIQELSTRQGSVLVFANTRIKTEKLAQRLSDEKVYAQAMHGDLRQSQRQRVLAQFRAQKFRILVATDVAGRGLDVPHIEHVINYDLPQSPEDYIHRLGRTARNGAAGFSLCMVSKQDQRKWDAIQRLKNGKESVAPTSAPSHKQGRKPFAGFKKKSFDEGRSFDRSEKKFENGSSRHGEGRSFDRSEKKFENGFSRRGEGRPFERSESNGKSFSKRGKPAFAGKPGASRFDGRTEHRRTDR